MAWTLRFLVWIAVLTISLSQHPPLPPIWGWGRRYDTYNNWQVTASAYKYPHPQQPRFPRFPLENEENIRPDAQDFEGPYSKSSEQPHDSRMSERSIITPPRTLVETRVFNPRAEESPLRRSDEGSSKILNNVPKRRRIHVDTNQIIFPGPTGRRNLEPEIPEACKKSTFCEDVLNYPQEEVNKLIEEQGIAARLDEMALSDTPDITQRIGPPEENIEMCNFTEQVVYPQAAVGADGKWYTLVNRKDNPVQGFRVEICREDGSACSNYAIFQPNYKGRCLQKHVYRTATTVETLPDGKLHNVEKQVKVPSCCSCVISAV